MSQELVDWITLTKLNVYGLCSNPSDGAMELLFGKGDIHSRLRRIERKIRTRNLREGITSVYPRHYNYYFSTLDDQDTDADAFTDLKDYMEEQSLMLHFSWSMLSGNPNDTAVSYLVEHHPEKIDFFHFSGNTNDIAVEYLTTHHLDQINWHAFCKNPSDKVIDFFLRMRMNGNENVGAMTTLFQNPNPRIVELTGRTPLSVVQSSSLFQNANPVAFQRLQIRWSQISENANDEIVDKILLPNMDKVSYTHLCCNSNDKIVDILLGLHPKDPRINATALCMNTNPRILPLLKSLKREKLDMDCLSKNPIIFVPSSSWYVLK